MAILHFLHKSHAHTNERSYNSGCLLQANILDLSEWSGLDACIYIAHTSSQLHSAWKWTGQVCGHFRRLLSAQVRPELGFKRAARCVKLKVVLQVTTSIVLGLDLLVMLLIVGVVAQTATARWRLSQAKSSLFSSALVFPDL